MIDKYQTINSSDAAKAINILLGLENHYKPSSSSSHTGDKGAETHAIETYSNLSKTSDCSSKLVENAIELVALINDDIGTSGNTGDEMYYPH